MVQKISKHVSKTKFAVCQKHTYLAYFEYLLSHRLIALRFEERSNYLQLDSLCQEIDASIDKAQQKYNFNNHRSNPSSSHPKYRQWRALRRIIFARLEIQCSMRQPLLFSEKLQTFRVKFRCLRSEMYQLCLKMTIMIGKKELNQQLLAEFEIKLEERQTYYDLACNLLNDSLRMCASRSVQLFAVLIS